MRECGKACELGAILEWSNLGGFEACNACCHFCTGRQSEVRVRSL